MPVCRALVAGIVVSDARLAYPVSAVLPRIGGPPAASSAADGALDGLLSGDLWQLVRFAVGGAASAISPKSGVRLRRKPPSGKPLPGIGALLRSSVPAPARGRTFGAAQAQGL